MKILVVDDSALARGVIRRVLAEQAKQHAFEFIEAANGQEALVHVRAGGIDLAMVDWNMPVLNGLSFVKEVRGEGRDLPIVMITAVSDEAMIQEACLAGVSEYIEKPNIASELWPRIKGFVK